MPKPFLGVPGGVIKVEVPDGTSKVSAKGRVSNPAWDRKAPKQAPKPIPAKQTVP